MNKRENLLKRGRKIYHLQTENNAYLTKIQSLEGLLFET